MNEFSTNQLNAKSQIQTSASSRVIAELLQGGNHAAYIGLDVHKDTITVAIAEPGRDKAPFVTP